MRVPTDNVVWIVQDFHVRNLKLTIGINRKMVLGQYRNLESKNGFEIVMPRANSIN